MAKAKAAEEPTTTLAVRVRKSLYEEFEQIAQAKEQSVSDIVRTVLREFLETRKEA